MDKKTDVKFVDTLVSHRILFDISMKKEGKEWNVDGTLKVVGSRDNEHFGELEAGVKSFDDDIDSALATVMLSLGQYVSSEDFLVELEKRVNESEQSEG